MATRDITDKSPKSYTGLGLIAGAAAGVVLAMLPLAGNIGWMLGATIGLANGLIVASIADDLGHRPTFTLSGIAAGALLGGIAGVLLDSLLVNYGYPALGIWVGGALGLVVGTIADVKKDWQGNHGAN